MTQFGYRTLGFGSGGGAAPYEVEWLVVAGGGAGGDSNHGGGGGAGGLRTSYGSTSGGGASAEKLPKEPAAVVHVGAVLACKIALVEIPALPFGFSTLTR